MPFADVNGIRLHYEREGTGIPVVLVTGLIGCTSFWAKTVPMLTDSFDVITLDNRGSGTTEYEGEFTMSDLADDIAALINRLGLGSAHVLGWSMGSHIALNLAAKHPDRVRSLTLVSSYLKRPARSAYILNALASAYGRGEVSADLVGMTMNTLLRTSGYFECAEKQGKRLNHPHPGAANNMSDQMRAVDGYIPSEDAALVRVPTLSVHGLEDIMTEPVCGDELADMIPGCRKLRVPGEGHILRPQTYIPAFREFAVENNGNKPGRE